MRVIIKKFSYTTHDATGNYLYYRDYQGYPIYKKQRRDKNKRSATPIQPSTKSSDKSKSSISASSILTNSSSIESIDIEYDAFDFDNSSITESLIESSTVSTKPEESSKKSNIEWNYFLVWQEIKLQWTLYQVSSKIEFENWIRTVDHGHKKSLITSRKVNSYKCPSSIGTFDENAWSFTSEDEELGSGNMSNEFERIIDISCAEI